MNKVILLILLIVATLNGNSQNNGRFRKITINDGLAHTDGTCVIQDKFGFIWIGTNGGIQRFDGKQLKLFINNTSPVRRVYNNRITSLATADDKIWVGSEGGIHCFSLADQKFLPLSMGNSIIDLSGIVITKILVHKNMLFIVSPRNIYTAQFEKEKLELKITSLLPVISQDLGSDLQFFDACYDLTNRFWVGTNKGLLALTNEEGKFSFDEMIDSKPGKVQLSSNNVTNVEYYNNHLWITAVENLEIISLSKNDHHFRSVLKSLILKKYFKTLESTEENVSISRLLIDVNDNLWISTSVGLMYIEEPMIENARVTVYNNSQYDQYSISANHCSDLFIDRSNCLWIGTWGGGVSYIDLEQKQFRIIKNDPLRPNSSLSAPFVRAVNEDDEGNIWVGTREGGINLINAVTGDCSSLKRGGITNESLTNRNIRSLRYHKGKMYIGTTNGLNIIDLKNNTIQRILQGSVYSGGNSANAIFGIETDAFDQLWLAFWGGGIGRVRFVNGIAQVTHISNTSSNGLKLSSNIVSFIYSDLKKNEILASTSMGLNRIKLDDKGDIVRIIYYTSNGLKSSLSSDYIWPIVKENDSTLWLGTLGGGLNKLILSEKIGENNQGEYHAEHYDTENGCPSNDIETLLMDRDGKLWIGGKGLSKFDPITNEFWNFDVNDGLQSDGFKIGASFKSSTGILYFGGISGLNYFSPEAIKKNQLKPSVALSSLKVFNQEIEPGKIVNNRILLNKSISFLNSVCLKYNENDFSIGFSALHFSNPEKCRFKYKLEGYDKNWITIDSKYPFANYSNLKYGEYKFIVDASNNDGIWSKSPVSIGIKISPPWWQSNLALLLYLILTLAAAYGAYFYSIKWIRLKNNLKLKEADEKRKEELLQLKLQFFTNISHEFKTPLTLILSPLEKLKSEAITVEEKHRFIDMITANAGRLLKLVNELIEFRKAEAGKLILNSQEADLFVLLKEIEVQFQEMAKQKSIILKLIESFNKPVWFDREKMTKIIYNLISNSIKFTNENGEIELEVFTASTFQIRPTFEHFIELNSEHKANEYTYIRVKDNGIGISAGSINQIFDRFFHLDDGANNHLGSGIGLALVKSLVMIHQGFIHVSSERFKGTEIIVGFPLGTTHIRPEEKMNPEISTTTSSRDILDKDIFLTTENTETIPTHLPDTALPVLLIVEDNEELRNMLIEHYQNEFKMFGAENGIEGLKIATKEMPELIISDIMMPEMDGVEMCRSLKEDIRTSHIPIVLLTAKSSIEHQIEGTEAGADVYIPKPFSLRLLDVQIKRLLESKALLKEKYASDVFASTREIVKNRKDLDFLDKLIEIINENIDNNDFNVNIICQRLGLGRTNLYKKIKSVTGNSLGEFIRSIRLKTAAKLLVSQDISISEVIFMVGINSNSYFTKAFKAQFGITPSEFVSQQRKDEKKKKE